VYNLVSDNSCCPCPRQRPFESDTGPPKTAALPPKCFRYTPFRNASTDVGTGLVCAMLMTTLKLSAALKPSVARDTAVGLPSGWSRADVDTNASMLAAVREILILTCRYFDVELSPDPPGTPASSSSTTLSTSPGVQSTAASNPLTSVGSGATQTTPGQSTSSSETSSGSGSNGGSSGTDSGSNSGSSAQPQST
jgi:hypothetical protein